MLPSNHQGVTFQTPDTVIQDSVKTPPYIYFCLTPVTKDISTL